MLQRLARASQEFDWIVVFFYRFARIPRVGWITSPGPISGVGFYIRKLKGNQMKYSVLLAALLAVSMTACGKKEEAAAPVEAPAAEAPAPMEAPVEATPAPMEPAAPADAAPADAAPADAAPAPAPVQ